MYIISIPPYAHVREWFFAPAEFAAGPEATGEISGTVVFVAEDTWSNAAVVGG